MELSRCNIKKILIFSQKKTFLIFLEMEPRTFYLKLEKQNNSTRRKFLILQQTENPKKCHIFWKESSEKNYIFHEVTCKAWKSSFYTFLYKEAKFSKWKCIFIIVIKRFFSFYNIFFYTQQALFFIFWEIFLTFTTIFSLFFLFLP